MAPTLKIGNVSSNDYISLTGGKLRVVNYSWDHAAAEWNQEYLASTYGASASNNSYATPVTDVFTLAYFGCDEEMRQVIHRLKTMVQKIRRIHSQEEPYWYWLFAYGDGELQKRYLLYNAAWKQQSKQGLWPLGGGGKIMGQLSLTRHPLAENVSPVTTTIGGTGIATVGGVARISDAPGTAPGRIARLELQGAAPGAATETEYMTDVWLGFRREGKGTTDFISLWECEDGTTVGADTTIPAASGANASPAAAASNTVDTAFSTVATMSERLHIKVQDVIVGTNYSHFAGRYVVLLRARLEDDDYPAEVKMYYGYRNLASPYQQGMVASDSVSVTAETYQFYELGEITIPPAAPWYDPTGTSTDEKQIYYATISLWASGTSGKSLISDCLVLVPTDYFLRLRDGYIHRNDTGPVDDKSVVVTEPDERVFGVNTGSTDYVRSVCTPEPKQFYLPEGDSIMVVAAQGATTSTLADYIYGDFSVYYRWEDFRVAGTISVA